MPEDSPNPYDAPKPDSDVTSPVRVSRHAFIAGIADFYVTSIVLGACLALVVAIFQRAIGLGAMWILPISLVTAIVYHVTVARRIRFISPGERMMGCGMVDGGKRWVNPYGRNRFAVFTVFLICLILSGNTWDGLAEGTIYSLTDVLTNCALVGAIIYGLTLLGSANWLGLVGVAVYFGGMTVRAFLLPESIRIITATIFLSFGLSVVSVSMLSIALRRREPQQI